MKQLTLSLLLMLLPFMASAEPVEIDGIWYNLIEKAKQAEVTSKPSGYYSGTIDIPDKVSYEGSEYSVTSIENNAFLWCSGLTSITIPNSVTSIGNNAFSSCSSLASITIPNNLTSISSYAFSGCGGLKSVTIPNSVTSIGEGGFYGCSGLKSVTIPNSVTSIGIAAFSGCEGLTSIIIPSSVTSIGIYAFSGCNSLTSVNISDIAAWCNIKFDDITSNPLLFAHHLIINGIELTNIEIPNCINSIGAYAFYECKGLTSINIPNSVTTIGAYAFYGCSGLATVNIPNGVTSIGAYAFYGCSGLTSATIGEKVSYIGSLAFANCLELKDVYCSAEKVPNTNVDAFNDSYIEYATLHVPESIINTYQTTTPWNGFGEYKTLTGETVEIPKCATPTISFNDGIIKFSCETEGVEFVSNISTTDTKDYYDAELSLSYKYKVTVYATKEGFENSDTATAEFTATGKFGDLNHDNKVNVADAVIIIDMIMKNEE